MISVFFDTYRKFGAPKLVVVEVEERILLPAANDHQTEGPVGLRALVLQPDARRTQPCTDGCLSQRYKVDSRSTGIKKPI